MSEESPRFNQVLISSPQDPNYLPGEGDQTFNSQKQQYLNQNCDRMLIGFQSIDDLLATLVPSKQQIPPLLSPSTSPLLPPSAPSHNQGSKGKPKITMNISNPNSSTAPKRHPQTHRQSSTSQMPSLTFRYQTNESLIHQIPIIQKNSNFSPSKQANIPHRVSTGSIQRRKECQSYSKRILESFKGQAREMNRRVEKSDYYVTCDNYNYNVEKTASRDLYKRMEELKILESEILRNQKY